MSQTDTAFTTADPVSTIISRLVDARLAWRSHFKGPSAPASPTTGMIWIDDDTPSATVWAVKLYDGTDWIEIFRIDTTNNVIQMATGAVLSGALDANSLQINDLANGTSAGDAVNKGQVDGIVQTVVAHIGDLSATDQFFVFVVPANCTIVNAILVSETSTAGSGGGTQWELNVRNLTAAVNLKAANKVTNGAEITADTAYALGLDQNLTPSANAVLELQVTKTGSPTSPLNACKLMLTYKVSV